MQGGFVGTDANDGAGGRLVAGARSMRGGRLGLLALAVVAAALFAAMTAGAARAEGGRENVSEVATCNSLTFKFKGFPNANNNTVTERVTIKQNGTSTVVFEGLFVFNGPEGENTVSVTMPPGSAGLDGEVFWNTNGFKGGVDILTTLNCSRPAYTIAKFQRIKGGSTAYTQATLIGEVGSVIEYEIIVSDTGNTKLTLENFEDKRCTNISAGPPGPLSPGETWTYTCEHVVVPADLAAGVYANQATVTGTPPKGQGAKKTMKSNIVKVKFNGEHGRENGEEEATCKAITFRLKNFPNAPGNKVKEIIRIRGKIYAIVEFEFNGPTGENTVPIKVVPPGPATIDGEVVWNTNGSKGGFDIGFQLTCKAEPEFSLEKLQTIENSGKPFTPAQITGKEGQTVDYEIVITNKGNVPMTFGALTDEKCEGIAGGPGGNPVEPGATSTFTCKHLLTAEDALVGKYTNTAEITGTYESESQTHSSNTVEAKVETLH
jgi:hypothetical protein